MVYCSFVWGECNSAIFGAAQWSKTAGLMSVHNTGCSMERITKESVIRNVLPSDRKKILSFKISNCLPCFQNFMMNRV